MYPIVCHMESLTSTFFHFPYPAPPLFATYLSQAETRDTRITGVCPSNSHSGTHLPLDIDLSFQSLVQCPFCKSFLLMVLHLMGGVGVPTPSEIRSPFPQPVFPFFSYSCALFCTFLHSCKTQLFSFHAIPHSLPKTPGRSRTHD